MIAHLREQVGPALITFLRWWRGELAALWPASRTWRRPSSTADIRLDRQKVAITRVARGQGECWIETGRIETLDDAQWAELTSLIAGHRTRVLLAAPLVHVLTLRLPQAARAHLRSAIPLQLREHAPVLPELLHWRQVDTRLDGDRLIVRVVVVRLSTLENLEQHFHDHGLDIAPILAEIDETTPPVPLRSGSPVPGTYKAPRPWAVAAIILALSPLLMSGALVIAGIVARSDVARAQIAAAPRLKAERDQRQRAELGRDLNLIFASPSATQAIERLAADVPVTAYATAIAAQEDGTIDMTLVTDKPDVRLTALAADKGVRDLQQVETNQTDGRTQLHYRLRLP